MQISKTMAGRLPRPWVVSSLVCLFAASGSAQVMDPNAEAPPKERKPFAKPETPTQRERIRTFDVQHIKAELTFDLEDAKLAGKVTHTIKPLHPFLEKIVLDLGPGLLVSEVKVGKNQSRFQTRDASIEIELDRPYQPNETLNVDISYQSTGDSHKGVFFTGPTQTMPDRPRSAWTHGEAEENHDWLPCYDYPNDRATSEMIITVAKPYVAISNGRLIETRDKGNRQRTFHWKMDVPHSSYLIAVAVGDFTIVRDKAGDLPLEYAALKPADETTLRRAMGKTPAMIGFFSEKLATPYPYPQYAQVCVPEFISGGMENIGATFMTDRMLAPEVYYKEANFDGLVAHELAHQWFGDLITCRDWSQIWLNEGFATYFAEIYNEHEKGEDSLRLRLDSNLARYLINDKTYRRAITTKHYSAPSRMFDAVTYAKGACVLHSLRGLMGDEAWWNGIRGYLAKSKLEVVSTDDFRGAMEKASQRDLKWFFEQWVERGGHPELKVHWRYEPEDQSVRIQVEQTQKTDETTPIFRLPTTIALGQGSQTRTIPIVIDRPTHEFVIPGVAKPDYVVVDPKGWLIKEIVYEKPVEEWIHQLEDSIDLLPRIEATRALGKLGKNPLATAALAKAWAKEKLPETRVIFVNQIAAGGPDSRKALISATTDIDPRVRAAAISGLGKLPLDAAAEQLARSSWEKKDETYGVRLAALRSLATWEVKDIQTLLEAALHENSWRDTIAAEALRIELARKHTDPSQTDPRQLASLYARPGRTEPLRLAAINAIGKIAADDPELRKLLVELTDDQSRLVRMLVWLHLGKIGETSVAPSLRGRLGSEDQYARQRLEDTLDQLEHPAARGAKPTPAEKPGRTENPNQAASKESKM